MPGYKDWIDAIEIKVDYFSAFMKAWIAFNAWYNFSGEVQGRTDKDCIEYIGSRPNRFKTQIENLLSYDSSEAKIFRDNLASLHSALLSAAITTQEYLGVRRTVSFSDVAIKNTNMNEHFEFRNVKYECSRVHGKIITIVIENKTSTELLRYEQAEYNMGDLQQQSAYKQLSTERQNKCADCYVKLVPYVSSSVLAAPDDQMDEKNQITIGSYGFVNDPGRISQAIVTILYMLRCCLAHGDISPDESANTVYRYAYEVLCAPLRKLK